MVNMASKEWVHPFERSGLGKAPFHVSGFEVKTYQAHPDAPIQPGSSCDYCGTGIMNVCWIKGADGRKFKVGIDCVRKTGETALLAAARMAARTERARISREKNAAARAEHAKVAVPSFLASNPGIEAALDCGHAITDDLKKKLALYGNLSEAQVNLAYKLHAETFAPAEREEAPGVAPIKDGKRQVIRGRIVSVKEYEGYMGRSVTKMTVKVTELTDTDARVWLCWGSIPTFEGRDYKFALQGAEVEFQASLKPGRESNFALFTRPTKAVITRQSETPADEFRW
jgi:hypothetical protein